MGGGGRERKIELSGIAGHSVVGSVSRKAILNFISGQFMVFVEPAGAALLLELLVAQAFAVACAGREILGGPLLISSPPSSRSLLFPTAVTVPVGAAPVNTGIVPVSVFWGGSGALAIGW